MPLRSKTGLAFTLAIASFAMAGCTSWKLDAPPAGTVMPSGAIPSGYARVCVVRTSVLALAVPFPTHDDGVLVGATRGPSFFCYLAAPGEHEIAIDADETEHARLTAQAGASYVLKEEVDNIFGYVKCRSILDPRGGCEGPLRDGRLPRPRRRAGVREAAAGDSVGARAPRCGGVGGAVTVQRAADDG